MRNSMMEKRRNFVGGMCSKMVAMGKMREIAAGGKTMYEQHLMGCLGEAAKLWRSQGLSL